MFPPMVDPDGGEAMMLRPSLCPHHAMVYQSKGRSYRELPLRIGEFGGSTAPSAPACCPACPAYGRSGSTTGTCSARRSRSSTSCRPYWPMSTRRTGRSAFRAEAFRLSLRGDLGGAGKYVGATRRVGPRGGAAARRPGRGGVPFYEKSGEAAFYGPKIDIQIRDVAGREMSLATIQVDFAQPERFDL